MAFLLNGLDAATESEIIRLLIKDLDDLKGSSKGKQREGDPLPDNEMAAAVFRNELVARLGVLCDRIMTTSLARAVLQDGEAIRQLSAREPQQPGQNPPKDLDDELVDKLAALYVTPGAYPQKESSGRDRRQCICCNDWFGFTDVARCPCDHEYCRGCLDQLFEAASLDESLFPPRCCRTEIPLDPNRIFLTPEVVGRFLAKKLELETRDRIYCHDPACSTFIPPQFVKNDIAKCVRCRKSTCTTCKGTAHGGDCPEDEGIKQVLELAREQGWQRCYSCHRLVELNTGCYHMTCRCKAQFCYLCGVQWKNCTCAQWDENRLLQRAEHIVNRQPDALHLDDQGFLERIQRMARNLEVNHNCDHHGQWRSLSGEHQCEECHHYLPVFIYECRRCRIQVCRRCRFNRL